jgi:predicted nucleic acid-binding protein
LPAQLARRGGRILSQEVKGIAATGFLVAFARDRDMHHAWAIRVAQHITEPLLTCESVLSDTAFHIGDAEVVFDMISEGLIRLSSDCNDHLTQLAALAKRYKDRQPDLADLCLIRISELYPGYSVITWTKISAFIGETNAK